MYFGFTTEPIVRYGSMWLSDRLDAVFGPLVVIAGYLELLLQKWPINNPLLFFYSKLSQTRTAIIPSSSTFLAAFFYSTAASKAGAVEFVPNPLSSVLLGEGAGVNSCEEGRIGARGFNLGML